MPGVTDERMSNDAEGYFVWPVFQRLERPAPQVARPQMNRPGQNAQGGGGRLRRAVVAAGLLALVVSAVPGARAGLAAPPGASDAAVRSETITTPDGRPVRVDRLELRVPENRHRPASRTVRVPVVRFRSFSPDPRKAVFWLGGGPGISNLVHPALFVKGAQRRRAPFWLLEQHDLVLVGYRGVDGSVVLRCPEVRRFRWPARDALSPENVAAFARAVHAAFDRLRRAGVDLDGYNPGETAEDVEAARAALGYGRIHLFAHSWGTRVAFLYALRRPERVGRLVLDGACPPGGLPYEPEWAEAVLRRYARLWAEDPVRRRRAPDLLAAMRKALAGLPRTWRGVTVDADKVRCMTHRSLATVAAATRVLEGYVAAAEGNDAALGYLSSAFEGGFFSNEYVWGQALSHLAAADFDPTRDYVKEMSPPGAILGSPGARLLWGVLQNGAWPVARRPGRVGRTERVEAEALLLSGALDPVTPAEVVRARLLPRMPKGRQVVLPGRAHAELWTVQGEAYRYLVETFLTTGRVDASRFVRRPPPFGSGGSLVEEAERAFPSRAP